MSMNRLFSLFIYLFIFAIFKEYSITILCIALVSCWLFKYRDYTVLYLICFLVVFSYISVAPQKYITEGNITKLTKNSIIIQKNGVSTMVSNCPIRSLDSTIAVEGKARLIESAPTSYGSQFSSWAKQNKITYSIYANNCYLLKSKLTPRSYIQEKIEQFDEKFKDILYKIVFQVSIDEDSTWYLFNSMGLSLVGILSFLRIFGKYIFYDKTQKYIELVMIIIFSLFYQFSFICTRLLLSHILQYTQMDSKERTGLLGVLCIFLYPQKVLSLQFLIPFGIRIINNTIYSHKKTLVFSWLMILQSLFFSKIQFGILLAYRFLLPYFGFVSMLSWLSIIFN